jgi:hypothetical protein
MPQITLTWLQEKIGTLYIANVQLQETVQGLTIENEKLKEEIKKLQDPEGSRI